MLTGLLAIGTNSGYIPKLIEYGKTRLLYEYGNYVQFAKLIKYVVNKLCGGKIMHGKILL